MSFPLFVDICSRIQPSNASYFAKLKHKGISGAFTQLSYGCYPDPYDPTGDQIYNILHYLKFCGCYQFFLGNPVAEARCMIWLLNTHYHMDKDTPVMLDVEGSSDYNAHFPQTHLINQWIDKMYDAGFHNIWIYTMASFVWSGYVKPNLLHHHARLWVAKYGGSEPGVNGASAWQFSSSFVVNDTDTDLDYLFMPLSVMTGKSSKPKHVAKKPLHKAIKKPNKVTSKPVKNSSKPKNDALTGTFKVTGKIERLK